MFSEGLVPVNQVGRVVVHISGDEPVPSGVMRLVRKAPNAWSCGRVATLWSAHSRRTGDLVEGGQLKKEPLLERGGGA